MTNELTREQKYALLKYCMKRRNIKTQGGFYGICIGARDYLINNHPGIYTEYCLEWVFPELMYEISWRQEERESIFAWRATKFKARKKFLKEFIKQFE